MEGLHGGPDRGGRGQGPVGPRVDRCHTGVRTRLTTRYWLLCPAAEAAATLELSKDIGAFSPNASGGRYETGWAYIFRSQRSTFSLSR